MAAISDDLGNKRVILQSRAVNPFNDWADWYGTDGEAVVTFYTMKERLWVRWNSDCISIPHPDCEHDETVDGLQERVNCDKGERVVEHEKFNVTALQAPGIYLDGTYYNSEDGVDESYTIIVPYPFLSPKLCREWIRKLNEQYDRNFELKITEEQAEYGGSLSDMGINRMRPPEKQQNAEGDSTE